MFQGLGQEYKKDVKTNEIMKNIEAYLQFCTLQNKLYYIEKERMQLYLPEGNWKNLILRECHDTHYASHLGMKRTTGLIMQDFYWPTLQ